MLTAANALAAAIASRVSDHDMIGTLSQLCDDCSDVLGATAVGIMMSDGNAPLEMMAASNHRATDIELYEIQADQGPCIEAARTGKSVNVGSPHAIIARWPELGPRAVAAGFLGAAACPLRWRGDVIGAINVFLPRARALSDDEQRVVQAFADVAAIAIIHADLPPVQDLARITRRALDARTVLEQAKGVIADQTGLDMAASFVRLRDLADQRGQPLEAFARELVNSTTHPAP